MSQLSSSATELKDLVVCVNDNRLKLGGAFVTSDCVIATIDIHSDCFSTVKRFQCYIFYEIENPKGMDANQACYRVLNYQ